MMCRIFYPQTFHAPKKQVQKQLRLRWEWGRWSLDGSKNLLKNVTRNGIEQTPQCHRATRKAAQLKYSVAATSWTCSSHASLMGAALATGRGCQHRTGCKTLVQLFPIQNMHICWSFQLEKILCWYPMLSRRTASDFPGD